MEQVKNIILEKTILDNFWLKILFTIMQVSNLFKLSLYKRLTRLLLQFNHLWILGSSIYVFIYEKKKRPNLLNKHLELKKDY